MSILKMNLFAAGTTLLALSAGCVGESFPDMNEGDVLPGLEDMAATLTVQGSGAKATMSADGDPAPARVGVLWTRDDASDVASPGKVIVQELPVTGSFPNNFTIELSPQPPADYAAELYTTGMLVVLSADAVVGNEITPVVSVSEAVLQRLTPSELSTLGIVSMPPVYITHARSDEGNDYVIDYSFSSEHRLARGYHLGLFNGEVTNRYNQWNDCMYANGDESTCGTNPYEDPNVPADAIHPTILTENDLLSITVGGADDLINTPAAEQPAAP